jgi:hypothetical protein
LLLVTDSAPKSDVASDAGKIVDERAIVSAGRPRVQGSGI